MIRIVTTGLCVMAMLFLASCTETVTIRAHASVTELEVGDEYIGTLNSGDEQDVDVSGRTLVTWKYDGSSESDYMTSPEDGKVWHLYAGYGSWDEW